MKKGIYLGDAYELIKQIPDKSIDLILTDPPYVLDPIAGGGMPRSVQSYKKKLDEADILNGFDYSILDEFVRVQKKVNCYIWCSRKQLNDLLNYFISRGYMYDVLMWCKKGSAPFYNDGYLKNKEYCCFFRDHGATWKPKDYQSANGIYISPQNSADNKAYDHPTVKPLPFIERLVANSTNPNDIVLDPFCGTGTTLKACQNLNREYIGFEINEKYYNIYNSC